MHLGKQGWYSDENLATAAYSLEDLKLPTTNRTGVDRELFYSPLFDNQLLKHCPKLKVTGR